MSFIEGLKDLGSTVAKFAPLLGGAIAGPGGAALCQLVSSAFGGEQNTDALINRIMIDPEASVKLIEIQNNTKIELEKLTVQQIQLEVSDRASARTRETDLAKYGYRDWVPTILALGFLFIYAYVQHLTIINPGGQDDVISARVQDIMVMIIGFYFGAAYKDHTKKI